MDDIDVILRDLIDCIYYPNPVSPFDAFVAPGKKKQFSEAMDKIQAYLARFPDEDHPTSNTADYSICDSKCIVGHTHLGDCRTQNR